MLCVLPIIQLYTPFITGANADIPMLDGPEELNRFLEAHNHTVAVLAPAKYRLSFMDHSIEYYKEKVGFAYASNIPLESFDCTSIPCFVGFEGTEVVTTKQPIMTPTHFSIYVETLTNGKDVKIRSVSRLQIKILEGEPFLLCVDCALRPTVVDPAETIYYTSSKVIELFDIIPKPGLYRFRPSDSGFIPYDGKEKTETIAVPIYSEEIKQQPLHLALFLDNNKNQENSECYDLFVEAMEKYKDKFTFSMPTEDETTSVVKNASIKAAERPFFAVFNSSDLTTRPYLYLYPQNNPGGFPSFLDRVLAGIEEKRNITQPDPGNQEGVALKRAVGSTIEAIVNDNSTDLFLFLMAPWCAHCHHLKPKVERVAKAMENSTIRFYVFEAPVNEFPEDLIPDVEGYPTIYFWGVGQRTEHPDTIVGSQTTEQLLRFLATRATDRFSFEEALNRVRGK